MSKRITNSILISFCECNFSINLFWQCFNNATSSLFVSLWQPHACFFRWHCHFCSLFILFLFVSVNLSSVFELFRFYSFSCVNWFKWKISRTQYTNSQVYVTLDKKKFSSLHNVWEFDCFISLFRSNDVNICWICCCLVVLFLFGPPQQFEIYNT